MASIPSLRATSRTRPVVAVLGATALLVPLAARAADRLLAQVPEIPGDSTLAGFERQLEVRAVTVSGSSGTGKPVLAPVVVTKAVDRTTAQFVDAFARSRVFPTLVLTNVTTAAGTNTNIPLQRYTLTNARIVDYRISDGANGQGNSGTEQISFAVGSHSVETSTFDASGRKTGSSTGTLSNQ